ncbi:MAG: phosphatidate cytidylyltransferase [Coriobacteriales bacterium]
MALNGKDVLQRSLVGAVYILIMGLCTLLSWWTTLLAVCVTAGICTWEFLNMAKKAGLHPYRSIGTVTAVCIPLAMGFNVEGTHIVALGLGVAFIGGVLCLLRFFVHDQDGIVDVAITVFAYLYVGLTLGAFLLLRGHIPTLEGGLMCLLILLSIWGNDAFAYLGGCAFGKHKFAPKISPKKTWEGVICGMAGGIVFWILVPLLCPNCGFGYLYAAVCGVLCGILGIMGDLTESHIKRSFDCKDSGTLMPGHGGLLDRSDSLLFVSVGAWFLVCVLPLFLQAPEVIAWL